MKCKSCGKEFEERRLLKENHCTDCARLIIKEMSRSDPAILTLKHPVLIKIGDFVGVLWLITFILGIVFALYWIFFETGIKGFNACMISFMLMTGPMWIISLIGQIQFEKDLG